MNISKLEPLERDRPKIAQMSPQNLIMSPAARPTRTRTRTRTRTETKSLVHCIHDQAVVNVIFGV